MNSCTLKIEDATISHDYHMERMREVRIFTFVLVLYRVAQQSIQTTLTLIKHPEFEVNMYYKAMLLLDLVVFVLQLFSIKRIKLVNVTGPLLLLSHFLYLTNIYDSGGLEVEGDVNYRF